ncbi:hypothetical protein [Kiloniella sp. EL199]|uniref:hypothetical protein n=1 Tax=Kiloniella sp. EL199 TaxID=2107581 RepID=UPI000EA2A8D4|nr:hypothetical protein [Kiloniella sp. EL199]
MWSRQMMFCYSFGILALLWGGYALMYLPADNEVKSLGVFLFKLGPFVCAALSVSLLDPDIVKRLRLNILAIFLCFGVFFFLYVPRMFFDVFYNQGEELYYQTLVIVPFLILSFTLAFRLGGGSTGDSLRVAFGLLILMLSGLEDLAYLVINPHEAGKWSPIPEYWDWPSHMIVRLGHIPSKYEAYGFIAFHLGLALFVAIYPFKFLSRYASFFGVSGQK